MRENEILEFSNAWNAYLKIQIQHNKENALPIEIAEHFYKIGRQSTQSEIEIELEETEYGKKLRHEKTLPSEIEIERAYYRVFFQDREKFTNAENFSWIAGAKAATKVFFQILKGEYK